MLEWRWKGLLWSLYYNFLFQNSQLSNPPEKTADVWKAVLIMNKIFQALFHATKNLQVENSHRYQMSCWFATHLRKWLVLSSKIGSLELSISLTHMYYLLMIAFIQRWSRGWYSFILKFTTRIHVGFSIKAFLGLCTTDEGRMLPSVSLQIGCILITQSY